MEIDYQQQESLAEQLLEQSAKAGASAAEVFQSWSYARPVFFEANRLKQLESSQTEGTALRLWLAGRPGMAVAHGRIDPQELVSRAIALSQLNSIEAIDLAANQQKNYPDLGQTVSVEQLVDWGGQAIAHVRRAYPEVLCIGEWDCEIETTHLINSQGLRCRHTDTTLSCGLSAEWVRGDDFLSVTDGQIQRNTLNPLYIADQIIQRLDWCDRNALPPPGRVPILFTSKAADLLWGTMQAALNGKRVLEGASPWSDRLGQQVTSRGLTLYQNPTVGPYSCPFDDEGTPTQPLSFLRDGTLQLFYTDRATGKLLGGTTTGNGFRPGLGSYPTPGLFNLLVQPGERSLLELIAGLEDGLVVDQMLGGSGGISGDFSINVDLGYRIQKGEIIGRVKDTMVAGNVYTALKNLVALGSDADWNGSYFTPSLIVEGLSVTS
ncbi:MAG: TldD/PmbA family protein [Aphanocapsa sp. GSE-SYN-MK-11-07L]|jgi:PmbA protein|nr:TldD/PmbA family protein [Aphanocapsa sp. GSE-SYN-MK-11-07L]